MRILIREFENENSQKKAEEKYDMEHTSDIFQSALKTTKITIVNHIIKLNKTYLQTENNNENNIQLFQNGMNNINISNWKYKDIDLSLLFDIYSIYRIHQYM